MKNTNSYKTSVEIVHQLPISGTPLPWSEILYISIGQGWQTF